MITKSVICLFCLLALSLVSHAQQRRQNLTALQRERKADLSNYPFDKPWDHSLGFKKTYDRFDKVTTYLIDPFVVWTSGSDQLLMTGVYSYFDDWRLNREQVGFAFSYAGKQSRIAYEKSWIVLSDGRRYDLAPFATQSVKIFLGGVQETVVRIIPLWLLVELIYADEIEMRVGDIEFQLTADQMDGIRDFIRVIAPAIRNNRLHEAAQNTKRKRN